MKKLQVVFGMLLCVAMLTTSCEKWNPWEEGGGGGTGGGNTKECATYGFLVRVPCGVSDLDNLWIQGNDGKYYQPCDAGVVHTMDLAYPLTEGAYVKFGYTRISGASMCDLDRVTCGAALPAHTQIRLTCIQPQSWCGTEWSDTLGKK